MATKPASKTIWTKVTPAVRTEPTGSKKNTGWDIDERPAREYMNWLFFNINEWVEYFEAVTDTISGLTGLYKAYVGASAICTHATLAAALADAGVVPGDRILVLDAATINTTIQITKNNISIEFAPPAIYTKGSATKCIQVSATGVQLIRGNFQSFIAGGDEAIRIDAGSDNTSLQFCKFKNNTTDVNDLSSTSQEVGSMTMV